MAKKKSARIKASDITAGMNLLLEQEFIEHGLNFRQCQVAYHLFIGDSGNMIAKKLYISISCVRYHISKIYEKTHSKNREDFLHTIWKGIFVSKASWKNKDAMHRDRKRHMYHLQELDR